MKFRGTHPRALTLQVCDPDRKCFLTLCAPGTCLASPRAWCWFLFKRKNLTRPEMKRYFSVS